MEGYIDRERFIKDKREWYCKDCDRRKNTTNGKIIYEIGEAPCKSCGVNDMLEELEDYPTADVEEVRRGKWIGEADGYYNGELVYDAWYCSRCNYRIDDDDMPTENYCPNCGAEMSAEEFERELWEYLVQNWSHEYCPHGFFNCKKKLSCEKCRMDWLNSESEGEIS